MNWLNDQNSLPHFGGVQSFRSHAGVLLIIHSLTHSLTHSLIRSLIRSLTHSLVPVCVTCCLCLSCVAIISFSMLRILCSRASCLCAICSFVPNFSVMASSSLLASYSIWRRAMSVWRLYCSNQEIIYLITHSTHFLFTVIWTTKIAIEEKFWTTLFY